MKIEELTIRRYGPLKEVDRAKLGEFTLFFGENEQGKTLIIDALVKLLFKKYKEFDERILRVEENPDGYIYLEDEGEQIKVPEKGDITKLFEISPLEGRNIFIIRDSDLKMLRESDHYRQITDRLTGLRSDEIVKIMAKLRETGKLTPQGDFSNRSPELLKSRISNSESLLGQIEEIDERYKKEDIEQIEEEFVSKRQQFKSHKDKLKLLEMARNREKYENGVKAIEVLKDTLTELKRMEGLDDDDLQNWNNSMRDIKKAKEERKKLKGKLRGEELKAEKKAIELKKKERELKVAEEAKNKINDDLKPAIKNYKEQSESLLSSKERARFHNIAFILSSILLIISILGLFFNSTMFSYIAVLFFLVSLIFGWKKYQVTREGGALKGAFEKIRLEASKYKLQGNTIEEVIHNIQKYEDSHSKLKEEHDELNEDVTYSRSIIEQINKQIEEKEKSVKQAEDDIEEIKERSGMNSLDSYTKKVSLKKQEEKLKEKQEHFLDYNFETRERDIEEKIEYWEKEISSIEKYKNQAKSIKFNEKEETKLSEESEKLEGKCIELENKLQEFREELEEIGRKAYEILSLESDYIFCQTSGDLLVVKDRLEDFIGQHKKKRTSTLKVMEIFEEIQTEEEQRVSKLFGKNTAISKYFSEITGGFYSEVNFLPDEKKICVIRKSGKVLSDIELSAGTYDQLYLTIRLGLGEQLMRGKKGFFIMDDPFIKSDKARLKRQIDLLKKISALGWQIIYFTAKDEVKEILEKDIKNNKIRYYQVPGISA